MKEQNLLSLTQACEQLSISTATGRNWIKLGKLPAFKLLDGTYYFDAAHIQQLQAELSSGKNTALKSRRNKSYISGNCIYKAYVSKTSPNTAAVQALLVQLHSSTFVPTHADKLLFIAECAIQLLLSSLNQQPPAGSCLYAYLTRTIHLSSYAPLLDTLIPSPKAALRQVQSLPELFCTRYTYVRGEDTLGLLYLSLKQLDERKAKGAYYTPVQIVRQLTHALPSASSSSTFFDPCCGTGNFLLQLPEYTTLEHVFACDLDPDSVHLAQLNAALHFQTTNMDLICSHITCRDFLQENKHIKADYIIGNPPWGYSFSSIEKLQLKQQFQTASKKAVESCDLFLEQALSILPPGGVLAFVLPEALLSVKSHSIIQKLLLEACHIRRIDYIGNVFYQVHCPSILLQCEKRKPTAPPYDGTGTKILFPDRTFSIHTKRFFTPGCLSFYADDTQYCLLQKLLHTKNALTLKEHADFALGIVTGNNRQLLSDTPGIQTEPVLKGCDIQPYAITTPKQFITFTPENFQQMAPEHLYRAPEKLVYRFIGKQLIFAYDNKQRLTLNSCNIVIPKIRHLHIKYILAVLNSSAAQFLFTMQFHSLKILRSHLEAIPIPPADSFSQNEIVQLTDLLLTQPENTTLSTCIDKKIAALYHLSDDEYQLIMQTLHS